MVMVIKISEETQKKITYYQMVFSKCTLYVNVLFVITNGYSTTKHFFTYYQWLLPSVSFGNHGNGKTAR